MSGKNNEGSNWRYIRLGMIAVLVIILVNSTALAYAILDETKTIEMGGYIQTKISIPTDGYTINVNIQVTNGGPVDVLLMDPSDYIDYLNAINSEQGGTFNYYIKGSSDSIKSKIYSITIPKSGYYYLVIDNTINPKGWTTPTGNVDVHLQLTAPSSIETQPQETSGFEAILAIFVIVALVFWRR